MQRYVKNGDPRLVILNRVAQSVVDSQRGTHPQFVFTYKGHPVTTINNNGWKGARKRANLTQARVHDLKHTFGRRLRAAGVPNETRKVLLGHRNGDITTHYSAPELQELLEAANRVCEQQSGTGCSSGEGRCGLMWRNCLICREKNWRAREDSNL